MSSVRCVCPSSVPEEYSSSLLIRAPISGLVLDGSLTQVRLECFTGLPSQLWRLERINEEEFFIINDGNDRVLEIEGGPKNSGQIVLGTKHGRPNQKWVYNPSGIFENRHSSQVIVVNNAHSIPGNFLKASTVAEDPTQHMFYFQGTKGLMICFLHSPLAPVRPSTS